MTGARAPVLVIGAGPIGLAMAVALLDRGLAPWVIERSAGPGGNVRAWGHVRLFSPWSECLFAPAVARLEARGWRSPRASDVPTGNALVDYYLDPLARNLRLISEIDFGSEVVLIKQKETSSSSSFELEVQLENGGANRLMAAAVVDASGTWRQPNHLGDRGAPVAGEADLAPCIRYGIPDALGAERGRYAARRVAVVGGGHSATNALLALAEAPARQIVWVLRNDVAAAASGRRDALPHRAALEERAADLVARGRVERIDGFTTAVVRGEREGAVLIDRGGRQLPAVDEIVVATGQRPDRAMHGALPLDLDADLECPTALAPLIDPRRHSCRTALAHGAQQLAHARLPGFYVAGIKSYGRAPTFLMATGYGQVVSIADALALGLPARRAVGA